MVEDWTSWLIGRFKGLKTCHWPSSELEIEYDNFTDMLVRIGKTKGKPELFPVASGLSTFRGRRHDDREGEGE